MAALDDAATAATAEEDAPRDGGDGDLTIRFTNGEAFAWGDVIEGEVVIRPRPGHSVLLAEVAVAVIEQDIDGIVVEPSLRAVGTPGSAATAAAMAEGPEIVGGVHEVVIARDLTVSPEAGPVSLPFSLAVPHGESLANAYAVAARAAVSGNDLDGDMEAVEPFPVLPPLFLQALIRGLDTLGDFALSAVRSEPKEDGTGDRYDLDFAPPEGMKQHLDGVRFLVQDDATRVWGELEVNPQEHTLAEHLASLVRADRERFPLEFDKAELNAAAARDEPSPEAARRLQELVGPYLK